MSEPNIDYPQTKPDEWRLKVEREIGEIRADVGTLKDGAAAVVDRLEKGSAEIGKINTNTALILQKLDDEPDGLIAKVNRHDTDIRELREDASAKRGAREWWKAIVLLIVGGSVSLAITLGASAVKQQTERVDALCETKFQSLDSARARGTYSQAEYDDQIKTLLAQGCIR